MYVTEERFFARSTGVAQSGGARDYCITTNICKEIDRLGRGNVAMCGALSGLGAEARLEETVYG